MKKITATIATFVFFFFATTTQAQAWRNAQGFTSGAKTALHRVWGTDMGYYDETETARIADSIYRNGNYVNIKVTNSGVNASGAIKILSPVTIQGTYLGSTDATFLGGPQGYTANLYLKINCGNLGWVFIPPATTNSNNTGKVAAPSGAVFCPPPPACDCETLVGEWKHGPETGPCAWKVRKTGMEPCTSCDYTTSWSFYVKWDGSLLYSWIRTYGDGTEKRGALHSKPWFIDDERYFETYTPNW